MFFTQKNGACTYFCAQLHNESCAKPIVWIALCAMRGSDGDTVGLWLISGFVSGERVSSPLGRVSAALGRNNLESRYLGRRYRSYCCLDGGVFCADSYRRQAEGKLDRPGNVRCAKPLIALRNGRERHFEPDAPIFCVNC